MSVFVINFLWLFLAAIVAAIVYVAYRLSFWYRQNVPFELTPYFKVNKRLLGDIDKECLAKHGKIFGTYEFLTPVLVVSEPDLIGRILIKEFSKFSDHRKWAIDGQMGAECIFASDYRQWKNQRSILVPAFTAKKLKSMQPIVAKAIDKLLAKLANTAKVDKETDLIDYYRELTLQIIIATALGVEIDCLDDPNNPILKAVGRFFEMKTLTWKHIIHLMSIRIAKLFDWYFLDYHAIKYLYGVLERVIDMKRQESNKQYDFINLMLEAEAEHNGIDQRKKLTETEIKDNALAFVLGGYETTQVILSKISYLMAVNPDAQDKLCAEIDAVWAKKLTTTENGHKPDITWGELAEMEYLDAVFNEALRFFPTAPRIERRVPKDTYLTGTKYGDIFLPKDSFVCVSTASHHDPEHWSEPEKFDPNRFLGENKQHNHPYAHYPFALGPRNCIGYRFALMEVKQCVFQIFRKFRFEVSEGTPIPLKFTIGLVPFMAPTNVTLKVMARN